MRTSTIEAAGGSVGSVGSPSSSGSPGRSTKRRRRAPSPVQWVPPSLKRFNLSPYPVACPVPLGPVFPFRDQDAWEERDSYEQNSPMNPYHPLGWKGRLPGPGLLGKDVMNTSMTVGRLVLF